MGLMFFIRSRPLIPSAIDAIRNTQLQNAGDRVPLTRRDIVLAALAAAGENATFTPVQIQKLFFLIDREAAQLVDGPHFAFRPYDYGPFDSTVYDQLDRLVIQGCLRTAGAGSYRVYSLTPQGYAEGINVLLSLPKETADFLRETAQWVRRLSFQQLVAAIYRDYPDMKVNSIFRG
jgi:hypothetical protein